MTTLYTLTTANEDLLSEVNQYLRSEDQPCSTGECVIDLDTPTPEQWASFADRFYNIDSPEIATVGGADVVTLLNYANGKGAYVFIVPNFFLNQLEPNGFSFSSQVRKVPVAGTDQSRLIIEPEFLNPKHHTQQQEVLYGWVSARVGAQPQDKEFKNLYEFLGGEGRDLGWEWAQAQERAVIDCVQTHQPELPQLAQALYEATVGSISTKEDVYTVMLELHTIQDQIVD